ncbi:MAG: hypothetical protein AB1941_06220 [Gemmatimonadota bacterium]
MKTVIVLAALLAASTLGTAAEAGAQNLGPQRRFIALGGYGSALLLDRGGSFDERAAGAGGGGRLMINLAPLSGPGRNLLDHATLGGFFSSFAAEDGVSARHYGGEVDVHLTVVPLGKVLDPFVAVGIGRLSTNVAGMGKDAQLAVSPGAGVRIPVANYLELRADARDVIVFGSRLRGAGEETTHNLELTAGLYLRL